MEELTAQDETRPLLIQIEIHPRGHTVRVEIHQAMMEDMVEVYFVELNLVLVVEGSL